MSKTQPISSCVPTAKLLPTSNHRAALLALFTMMSAACGGDDDGAASLAVAWAFEAGDCASNGIERLDITVTPGETASFSCATGQGIVGDIFAGETHSILAQGLDSGGIVRVENMPHTVSFSGDKSEVSVELSLRPKPVDVTVTWDGCPPGVTLPYFITLYRQPASPDGALEDDVASLQAGCKKGQATLEKIAPGDYVVEVDSRAVVPAVVGTAKVTVIAGEDAKVHVAVP